MRRQQLTGRSGTRGWPAACLAVLLLVGGAVHAQDRPFPTRNLTTGSAVRGAFKDVVALPRTWTVRVIGDDKTVALGTIVSEDGWILTKASQLNGVLSCRLHDGREFPAQYVGHHRDHDLALLKIAARDLPVAEWKTEADPRIGQWLATPGHDDAPLAVGIVSVGRRDVPLADDRGVLGIELEMDDGPPRIKHIMPNSGAEKARLETGDVIVRVGEALMDNRVDLVDMIRRHRPGDTLELTVRRGDGQVVVTAILTPPLGDMASRISMQNQMGGELSVRRSGFPAILQHDTVLRPHECGGPVVNLDGNAIGINIARAGRTESYAIPADVLLPLIEEMRSGNHPPPLKIAATSRPPAGDSTAVSSE